VVGSGWVGNEVKYRFSRLIPTTALLSSPSPSLSFLVLGVRYGGISPEYPGPLSRLVGMAYCTLAWLFLCILWTLGGLFLH
jgi:hypothetical protein